MSVTPASGESASADGASAAADGASSNSNHPDDPSGAPPPMKKKKGRPRKLAASVVREHNERIAGGIQGLDALHDETMRGIRGESTTERKDGPDDHAAAAETAVAVAEAAAELETCFKIVEGKRLTVEFRPDAAREPACLPGP